MKIKGRCSFYCSLEDDFNTIIYEVIIKFKNEELTLDFNEENFENMMENFYNRIKKSNLDISIDFNNKDFDLSAKYIGDGFFEFIKNNEYENLLKIVKSIELNKNLCEKIEKKYFLNQIKKIKI